MKKLAAIVVLILFLVNTMGFFVVFRYNQYRIQQEMIARIRCGDFHDNIVILKIFHPERDPQFRSLKSTEFSYFGKFYDLVAQRKSGDTTFLYSLHDTREEDLVADFSTSLRRNGDSTRKDHSILAMLYNLITQALIQQTPQGGQGQGTAFIFPAAKQVIIPVYLVHFAPPPKAV